MLLPVGLEADGAARGTSPMWSVAGDVIRQRHEPDA